MKAVLVGAAVFFAGCGSAAVPSAQKHFTPLPRPLLATNTDTAVVAFFKILQPVLPKEMAVCLYGVVQNDTAHVAFIRPAHTDSATSHSVHYRPCPNADPAYYGHLRYLGIWHNHPNNTCAYSPADDKSFYQIDVRAVIDWVGCGAELMGRKK